MDQRIVIGLDPHKDVLVAVAVDGNGRQLDVRDATARPRGYGALLTWARKLGPHRWAVEDVRHVAGGLVRFLLAEDEQAVWVPTHMSADYRRRVRAIGKSDPIDALACARAALAKDLPVAVPETDVREIKMLLDHREDLVGEMVRMCCRLRWHLHDIDPDFAATIPFGMFTGCAPIPASSENSQRVRLNRGGNRRMNAALHRIAITQKRMPPPAQDYLSTRRAMGNSNTEAIRALKRHLARRVFTLLRGGAPAGQVTSLAAEKPAPIAA